MLNRKLLFIHDLYLPSLYWGAVTPCRKRISSLRNLSEFEVLLLRLSRAGTAIIIDKEYDDDYIQPEKQPEASFS